MSAPSIAIRQRRPFGASLLHVPQTLRALVRADEVWLVILAAVVGGLAGVCVVVMNITTGFLHVSLFALPAGTKLSEAPALVPIRAFLVPTLGGVLLGAIAYLLTRYYPHRAIDPVEANALFGGRLGLKDSLVVTGQTVLSNGVGGSVGLEAGYAQIGAAVASRLGRAFRLRRNDLRVILGCGAAAAIAGAFNAPLSGSFYGIELIIGTYSLATLPPVIIASLCGVFMVRALIGGTPRLHVVLPHTIHGLDYVPLLAVGVVAGLVGIAIMRGVTLTEDLFRRSGAPVWMRPVFGGMIVGTLAILTPQVLSSGHSALHATIGIAAPGFAVATVLLLKSVASAVSIGSGFRGGLFFASLFLGSLVGKVFAAMVTVVTVLPQMPQGLYAVVGMSALATAIVGGPMTMTFLALESTGDFSVAPVVLGASILSALTVRRIFGYSFTTWRFHLRGEVIRSAVDIGWIHNLSVGRMMRRDVRTIRTDLDLEQFRREFPLGATQRVVVLDHRGAYAGILYPAEAHAAEQAAQRVGEILHHQDHMLTESMSIKEAIAAFEQAECDALAVVDSPERRQVRGLLTEQFALRRYTEELDRRRRELSGE